MTLLAHNHCGGGGSGGPGKGMQTGSAQTGVFGPLFAVENYLVDIYSRSTRILTGCSRRESAGERCNRRAADNSLIGVGVLGWHADYPFGGAACRHARDEFIEQVVLYE